MKDIKIIFTENDKKELEKQMKNLDQNNVIDLDKLIVEVKKQEDFYKINNI